MTERACKCCGKMFTPNKGRKLCGRECILKFRGKSHAKTIVMTDVKRKCATCEEETVCCFDFDHVPEKGEKVGNISEMTQKNKNNEDEIRQEIAKCRLLCCICHFRYTNETKMYHVAKGL